MSNYKVSLYKGKVQEEFEDSKEVIRIRKLKKDRQHNGQKKNINQWDAHLVGKFWGLCN